jgi:hypothetical protein
MGQEGAVDVDSVHVSVRIAQQLDAPDSGSHQGAVRGCSEQQRPQRKAVKQAQDCTDIEHDEHCAG